MIPIKLELTQEPTQALNRAVLTGGGMHLTIRMVKEDVTFPTGKSCAGTVVTTNTPGTFPEGCSVLMLRDGTAVGIERVSIDL